MGVWPSGRVLLIWGTVLALLAPGMLVGSAVPTEAATPGRVESAWSAYLGAGGANGSATVRVYDTARGSVALSLRRLTPSVRYPVIIRRGACGSLGTQVVTVGTFTATASGALSASAALTTAKAATIRSAAGGTNRVSLVVGSGSLARCGTLVKSLAVTPQIWFGPRPATSDYATLFAPDAPWPRVAGRTAVFANFASLGVGYHPSDAELRRMVDALKARQIRIAIQWYALTPEGGCGVGVNGFGGGTNELRSHLRRIRFLGGTVSFISINEPFSGGVLWDGANACHWSVATVAKKVAGAVKRVWAEFPGIEFGLIEGYNGPAWIDYVKEWISAYEAAVGERLPFLHLDTDYTVQGWADGAGQVQAYVRGRGTRFGVFYTTWPPPVTDAEWFAGASASVRAFEIEGAGPPDDAIFQVWTEKPSRLLPETGRTTLTRLMADYIRTRTAATVAASPMPSGGTIALTGSVRTLGGDPIAGARVSLSATPRDGRYQLIELRGTVPAGARAAAVAIKVNAEGVGPGTADLTFYEIGYSQGGALDNLVPNGRFDQGAQYWGSTSGDGSLTVVPSDRGSGSMMRVVVTPAQSLHSGSPPFAVTPGAAYRMWAAVKVPEASIGSAYLAAVFLKDVNVIEEVGRDRLPLAPAANRVGSVVTDAAGAFTFLSASLGPGAYHLAADYAGNARYWPAGGRTDTTVP